MILLSKKKYVFNFNRYSIKYKRFSNSESGVLNRYPSELNISWTTVAKDPITSENLYAHMTGADILRLLKKDYSVKVFERLQTKLKKKSMSKRMSLMNKMDIFKDYSYPQPFPVDKFLKLPNGSPNQAYLMLGTKGTGRCILNRTFCSTLIHYFGDINSGFTLSNSFHRNTYAC